jgi:hypothetical protein
MDRHAGQRDMQQPGVGIVQDLAGRLHDEHRRRLRERCKEGHTHSEWPGT